MADKLELIGTLGLNRADSLEEENQLEDKSEMKLNQISLTRIGLCRELKEIIAVEAIEEGTTTETEVDTKVIISKETQEEMVIATVEVITETRRGTEVKWMMRILSMTANMRKEERGLKVTEAQGKTVNRETMMLK